MPDLSKIVSPDPQKALKKQKGGSTSKVLKAISHKELLDRETGEVIQVGHVTIEEKDCNFEKLWLGHVCDAISEIGTKKIDVLLYLFRNRNAENIVICTNKQLAEAIGVSYDTVARTLSALVKHNVIRRGVGHIQLNPDVIFKGAYGKRMNILLSYRQADDPPMPVDPKAKKAAILADLTRKMREFKQGEDFSDDDALEMLSRAMKDRKSDH